MTFLRGGRLLLITGAVVLILSGCQAQSGGVTIPSGSEDLPPCPVQRIPVEELSALGKPGCDLAGTSLVFENEAAGFAVGPPSTDSSGPTLTVPAAGAVFSQGNGEGRELLVINWGVPGVGVAAIEDERLLSIWASSDAALDLQHQQLEVENVDVR